MTDKERLAILEKMAYSMLPFDYDGIKLRKSLNGGGRVCAYVVVCGCVERFMCEEISVSAAYSFANQKLADEREASRTPEERRLREAIAKALKHYDNWECYGELKVVVDGLRKALEQGA